MSRTSQALKRLGVGSVSAVTVLAMPYVGVASAFAAPGDPPVTTITSQLTNAASPRNDGTDTQVKISANVAYTPTSPASANQPAAVVFSYTPSGGAAVVIGTDSTAPYSALWTPPVGGGAFTISAQAVTSSSAPDGAAATKAITVADAPSVHIVSPAEGAQIGQFGGKIVVSGTRSGDFPALSLTAQSRDNGTGTLSTAGAASTVAATTGGTNWSAVVAVPACTPTAPATTCNVVINAQTTGGVVNSDETTEATLYTQTLTKASDVTVTPSSATVPVGGSQVYAVKVVDDQNGAPVGGLKVQASSSNTAVATIATSPVTTDGSGTAPITVNATGTAGSATITFQTVSGAAFDSNVDFTRTATFTSYTSTPTSATLTATPSKSLYAQSSEYPPSAASTSFPLVKLCVVDQNGNGTPAGTGGTPVVTDSHRDSTMLASAPATSPTVTVTPLVGTSCYQLSLAGAPGTFGTDTISAYFEQNGTPGQQAGDPAATPLVLNYGTLNNASITALDTQSQKGTATTVSFKVLDPSGRPFANRTLTLTNTAQNAAGGFTATQPSGTSTTPPAGSGASAAAGTLYATTDANGVLSVTVNSPTTTTTGAQTVTVTATDNLTTATQKATGATKQAVVEFRDKSVALTTLTQAAPGAIVSPVGSPNSSGTARPGDVIDGIQYTLSDANGGLLKNTSVTVSLDHGFFAATCPASTPNPERYTNCTFTAAPADGAVAGSVADAKTKTLTSDASGVITFSLAIGRDTAFDATGTVISTLTAVANGGTKSAPVATFTTKNVQPINGGSVKLVPVTPTTALSGDVQAADANTSTPKPVTFAVHVLDQFGNLVQLPTADVTLDATGGTLNGASLSTTTAKGSYTGSETPFTVQSTTTSTSGAPATVTATWNAPVTTFKGATTGTAPNTVTTYTTVAGSTVKKTDSFTVNFYAIDLKNLVFSFGSTPSNTVPVNTAVTTSATVKDQKGNPVQGLTVQFVRSGPNDAAGNSQTGGSTTQFTNAAGKAGTSYSSGTPGTATVTVIVTDNSGNELSRGVQNVTFTKGTPTTGVPTISISTTAINVGKSAIVTVRGKAGTSIQLFALTRPATAYQVVRTVTLPASGVYTTAITPRGNTRLFARSAAGDSGTVAVSVRPAMSLVGSASGKTGTFTGTIVPGHGNVAVRIFTVKNGAITLVGTTRTAANGHYSFSRTFAATGAVTFIAQTLSDGQNLSTQSNRVTVTFK